MVNDLSIYENYASEWWNPESARFRSLHTMTPFRLNLLESFLAQDGHDVNRKDPRFGARAYDWTDKHVADLGCGGGLLAIPLACRGAQVIGMDLSASSLESARREATKRLENGSLQHVPEFIQGNICDTGLLAGSCDVVLLADVLEHVEDYNRVLGEAARILAPGGFVYVNTINRTPLAKLLGVQIAEGIGLVPAGTHDYRLFITPAELNQAARSAGLELTASTGEAPLIWKTLLNRRIYLRRSHSRSVAYSAFFTNQRARSDSDKNQKASVEIVG